MSIDDLVLRLAPISPLVSYEHIVERHIEKYEAITRAVELFNDEKYWGAHEALEGVWKGASGEEKSILNGIILVAAAFVHDEKDEPEICLSILQRARKKLEGTTGKYHGINIDRIADLISRIINSGRIERFMI
jgi:predicted metal-dependent hydrolase